MKKYDKEHNPIRPERSERESIPVNLDGDLKEDTLEYLKMGGRISSTKAALGNLLSIKPILEVKDGLVVQKSQVRGKKQIYSTLAKTIVEKFGKDLKSRTIIIGCGDNIEDLEIMKESLEKEAEISNVYFVNIGCVVCSHSGPGVMGISCI